MRMKHIDALDEKQFQQDVVATEEEQYSDASDDDSFLGEALDDYKRNQSGGRQFHFKMEEFRPRVNHRFGTIQRNYCMRIEQNENLKVEMSFKNLSEGWPMF